MIPNTKIPITLFILYFYFLTPLNFIANANPLADLEVTNITFSNNAPKIGETVEVIATLKNNGSDIIKASVNFYAPVINKTIIESPHPYPEDDKYNANKVWNLTMPHAKSIRIHFEKIELYYAKFHKDHLYIKDQNGKIIMDYTYPEDYFGAPSAYTLEDVWTPYVQGDTVKLELNISENRYSWHKTYGFKVDKYEYLESFKETEIAIGGYNETKVNAFFKTKEVGEFNISVVVDEENLINESNESNNILTKTLRVQPSLDLSIVNITLNPENPIAGDILKINTTIINTDYVDFIAELYVDGTQIAKSSVNGSENSVLFKWNATPSLHNITIVLDPENIISEYNESNNILSKDITVYAPDLTLEKITFNYSPLNPSRSDLINISAMVINNGKVGTNFTIGFYERGIINYTLESYHNKTNYNYTYTITHPNANWIKLHFAKLEVRLGSIVKIYDKNHTLVEYYDYTKTKAQNFSDIWTKKILGDTAYIELATGDYESYGFKVDKYEYSGEKISEVSSAINSSSHSNITVSWNATYPSWHNITVMLDPRNEVQESAENNNNLSKPIFIQGADLIVSNITLNPYNIKDNDTVLITAYISNIGLKEANNFGIGFYVDEVLINSTEIKTLTPNNSLLAIAKWSAITGYHSIKVIVDYVHNIYEETETNNVLSKEVWVSGADFAVLSLNINPEYPYDQDRVIINATLINNGTIPSYARFYFILDNLTIANSTLYLEPYTLINRSTEWNATAGVHNITVLIDPRNEVVEENESNNFLFKEVYVNATMDFAILSIVVNQDKIAKDGDLLKINTSLINYGNRNESVNISITQHQIINYTPSIYGNVQTISHNSDAIRLHFTKLKIPSLARVNITDENGTVLVSYNYSSSKGVVWGPWIFARKINIFTIGGTIANPVVVDIDKYELLNQLYNTTISINANETKNISAIWNATTGNHTIICEIKSNIVETNSENNFLNKTIYVFPSKDIAVLSLNIDPEKPKNGEKVNITATLKNLGFRALESKIAIWKARKENYSIETPHFLNKKYSRTWTLEKKGADYIGLHFSKIKTETSGDHCLRIYDKNNTLIADYSYFTGENKWIYAKGSLIKVEYKYNWGEVPWGFSVDKYEYKNLLNSSFINLGINEAKTINANFSAITGLHTIEVIADPLQEIEEINESNNKLNKTITVSGPDLTVLDVKPKDNKPTAIIKNIGIASANNVTISFGREVNYSLNSGWLGYGFNKEFTRAISKGDAIGLRVHFTEIKINGYIYIKDNQDNIAIIYSSEIDDVWTPWVQGNQILISAHAKDNPLSRFEIDKYEYAFDSAIIDTIGVNEEVEVTVDWKWNSIGNLTVIADPDNTIIESDESNNILSKTIGSDLDIYSMWYLPEYPLMNRPIEINAIIENKGMISTEDFKVMLKVDNISIESKELALNPMQRENITFSYTPNINGTLKVEMVVDPDNKVIELDESNNNQTRQIIVYKYSGYGGGSTLETYKNGTINGSVYFALGESADQSYLTVDSTEKLEVRFKDIDGKVNGKVKLARLYLYWGFSYLENYGNPVPIEVEMEFNSEKVEFDRSYTDTPKATKFDVAYGVYAYDVTDLIKKKENTAKVIRKYPFKSSEIGKVFSSSVSGVGLLVITEDSKDSLIKYWINEGADILWSDSEKTGLSPDECITYAPFYGEVDTDMVKATLWTVVPYGGEGRKGQGLNTLYFNSKKWDGFVKEYFGNSRVAISEKEIKNHLRHKNNIAKIQDRGDFMLAANAFLILKYPPDLTVVKLETPYGAVIGKQYIINATIKNIAKGNAGDFNVTFYSADEHRETVSINRLSADEVIKVNFTWNSPKTIGVVEKISVEVDPENTIEEWNEDNNIKTEYITIMEGGFGNESGPRGTGGGKSGGMASSREEITGYLMKGSVFSGEESAGGTSGEFSLLEYLMKAALWIFFGFLLLIGWWREKSA